MANVMSTLAMFKYRNSKRDSHVWVCRMRVAELSNSRSTGTCNAKQIEKQHQDDHHPGPNPPLFSTLILNHQL